MDWLDARWSILYTALSNMTWHGVSKSELTNGCIFSKSLESSKWQMHIQNLLLMLNTYIRKSIWMRLEKKRYKWGTLLHNKKENCLVGRHFKITEIIWKYMMVNFNTFKNLNTLGTTKHILSKNIWVLKVYNICCYVAIAKTFKPSTSFSHCSDVTYELDLPWD